VRYDKKKYILDLIVSIALCKVTTRFLLPSKHNCPYDSKMLKSIMFTLRRHVSANTGPTKNVQETIECSFYCFLYVLCWPEDGPVLVEICRLNVNIINFNTLLS
jgi:hypothetical protein